jgi:hypothetical protein
VVITRISGTIPIARQRWRSAIGWPQLILRIANYAERLQTFRTSLRPLSDKITSIRSKYSGVSVTATEPVFGYVADALKLTMRNQRFQLAVMSDTEPSARDVAAFQRNLQTRKARSPRWDWIARMSWPLLAGCSRRHRLFSQYV